MCGIAGYSVGPESRVDRTLAAQALLTGIAERGSDAVGYAWAGRDGRAHVHKQRSGATALLERVIVPQHAVSALVHVRDYTKGHPTIEANNHPVRHGAVVGVHNGIIVNDEEILADYGFERAEPGMTVDSEAIFALAELTNASAQALERLYGAMATAWLDERRAGVVFAARAVGRPLWTGQGTHETLFASTRETLELAERALRMPLRKRELGEGTLVALESGRIVARERFRPDRSFEEETKLRAVRAPHERTACLERFAAIAAL